VWECVNRCRDLCRKSATTAIVSSCLQTTGDIQFLLETQLVHFWILFTFPLWKHQHKQPKCTWTCLYLCILLLFFPIRCLHCSWAVLLHFYWSFYSDVLWHFAQLVRCTCTSHLFPFQVPFPFLTGIKLCIIPFKISQRVNQSQLYFGTHRLPINQRP